MAQCSRRRNIASALGTQTEAERSRTLTNIDTALQLRREAPGLGEQRDAREQDVVFGVQVVQA